MDYGVPFSNHISEEKLEVSIILALNADERIGHRHSLISSV